MEETKKRTAGRPAGKPNRSKLMLAQMKIENIADLAIDTQVAIMTNDKDFLGVVTDVSATLRFNVSKVLYEEAKELGKPKNKATKTAEKVYNVGVPKVYATAKSASRS